MLVIKPQVFELQPRSSGLWGVTWDEAGPEAWLWLAPARGSGEGLCTDVFVSSCLVNCWHPCVLCSVRTAAWGWPLALASGILAADLERRVLVPRAGFRANVIRHTFCFRIWLFRAWLPQPSSSSFWPWFTVKVDTVICFSS